MKNKNMEIDNQDFDIKDLYTSIDVAKKEVHLRWNDSELKEKVINFIGSDVPDIFRDEPKSVLFRFIATPNIEASHFFEFSDLVCLKPVYIEFLNDKFCTRNKDKMSLVKMSFFEKKNTYGKNIKPAKKIISIECNDNKKFCEISTHSGEKLIDFHHDILEQFKENVCRFDMSEFKKNGEDMIDVYAKFFAIFVCHGIIFENYIVKDDSYEKKFVNEVVRPAYNKVMEYFNLKPLVVPLLPINEEDNEFWMHYSSDLEDYVKNKIG